VSDVDQDVANNLDAAHIGIASSDKLNVFVVKSQHSAAAGIGLKLLVDGNFWLPSIASTRGHHKA